MSPSAGGANSPPPPPPHRRRSRRFAAAALALGVVFVPAALEIAVRAFGIAPPLPSDHGFAADDILPWKLDADLTQRVRTDEFEARYTHNSLGFRGRDRPFEKPPGAFRIVGIGDSFTYGVGVDDDATFLARLESALDARTARRVEAINLAIPRYWPEPEALVLEHYGLKFRPDLVLVGMSPNDVEDTRRGLAGLRVSRGYLVTDRLGDWADLGRWLYLRSGVARILIGRAAAGDARDAGLEPAEDEEAIWERIEGAFDRMARLSAAADAGIVFLYIPQNRGWRAVETESARDRFPLPRPAARTILTPTARLRRFCAAEDCQVVEVAPAMRAHPRPESLYYPKDGHLTGAGHSLVAEVLGRELEERGLFPSDGAASSPAGAAR